MAHDDTFMKNTYKNPQATKRYDSTHSSCSLRNGRKPKSKLYQSAARRSDTAYR